MLKKGTIQISSEAESEPWQEGGREMADHASVVISGVVEGGDIL